MRQKTKESVAMNCKYCGNLLISGETICSRCGKDNDDTVIKKGEPWDIRVMGVAQAVAAIVATLLLPFLKIEIFGVSESFTLWELYMKDGTFLAALVILGVVGNVASAIMSLLNKVKASQLLAALGYISVIFYVYATWEDIAKDGVSLHLGFYLYIVAWVVGIIRDRKYKNR